jgi:hypothetical protein
MAKKRKTILVEKQVQGALGWRIASHWLIFMGLSVTVTCSLQMLSNFEQRDVWTRFEAALVGQAGSIVVLLALLPWFVHDSLKLSNRFAGPMVRLHKSIVELKNQDETSPVVFRHGDFWQDIAVNFNELRMRVLAERQQLAQAKAQANSKTDTKSASSQRCEQPGSQAGVPWMPELELGTSSNSSANAH